VYISIVYIACIFHLVPSLWSQDAGRQPVLNGKARRVLALASAHPTIFLHFHLPLNSLLLTSYFFIPLISTLPHSPAIIVANMGPTRFDILFDKDGNPETPQEFEEIVSKGHDLIPLNLTDTVPSAIQRGEVLL